MAPAWVSKLNPQYYDMQAAEADGWRLEGSFYRRDRLLQEAGVRRPPVIAEAEALLGFDFGYTRALCRDKATLEEQNAARSGALLCAPCVYLIALLVSSEISNRIGSPLFFDLKLLRPNQDELAWGAGFK